MAVTTRFARILCAIDYSETSRHALKHAWQLAAWYSAPLTVLHVLPPYVIALTERPDERAMEEAKARADSEVLACRTAAAGAVVQTDVVIDIGDPAGLILEQAAKCGADLLVLGTHGHGGFERLVMGSVAEKVLRKATCPVLTVPPHAPDAAASRFARLLCPVDFSDCSLAAYELARSVARQSGGIVTLAHIIEWPWAEPPAPSIDDLPLDQARALDEYRRYVTTSAEARLETLAAAGRGEGVETRVRVMHGRAARAILSIASDTRTDLIVMGVHGRHAADLALFGSVTHQIVRTAECPVLTYRQ